jgi:hypothetical protein
MRSTRIAGGCGNACFAAAGSPQTLAHRNDNRSAAVFVGVPYRNFPATSPQHIGHAKKRI